MTIYFCGEEKGYVECSPSELDRNEYPNAVELPLCSEGSDRVVISKGSAIHLANRAWKADGSMEISRPDTGEILSRAENVKVYKHEAGEVLRYLVERSAESTSQSGLGG